MLKQHLTRESIANDRPLDNPAGNNQKKYFIRQNLPIFKQQQKIDVRDNLLSRNSSQNQKNQLQNTDKFIHEKRQVQQHSQEISSFNSSFSNDRTNNCSRQISKTKQLPFIDSRQSSLSQTPKQQQNDQKSILDKFQKKLISMMQKDNPSQNTNEVANKKQIPLIKLQYSEAKTPNNSQKRLLQLIKTDKFNKNSCDTQNTTKQIWQAKCRNRRNLSIQNNIKSLCQIQPISPLQSKTPAASCSYKNSFHNFPGFNDNNQQSIGLFTEGDYPFQDSSPLNSNIQRRQSLNFSKIDSHPEENRIIHLKQANHSRVVSITRIGQDEKVKFQEAASKMYIQKRQIADDEDLQYAKEMQQDDDNDSQVNFKQNNFENTQKNVKSQGKQNNQDIEEDVGNKSDHFITNTEFRLNHASSVSSQNMLMDQYCQKPTTLIGNDAPQIFYNHYKNINKVIQQNEHYGQEQVIKESLQTKLIKSIINKNVLPKKLNLIKKNGNVTSLSFSNFNCGQNSADIIAEGIKSHPLKDSMQNFSLKNSYLNSTICSTLLKSIPITIIDLNLSNNYLDVHSINYLKEHFLGYHGRLQVLNAEKCKLSEECVNCLLEGLQNNSSLRKLNLSQNQITSKSCDRIKQLLLENFYIEELYLHWNQIKDDGGVQIALALQSNTTLTVIDLSKNPLGGDTDKMLCSQEIKNFLMFQQSNIVHIDLSNCDFNQKESEIIKQGLSYNHMIYGFHFSGNTGFIDSQGYLQMNNYLNSFRNIHLNHRIEGVSSQNYLTNKERSLVSIDNCWICEGKPFYFVFQIVNLYINNFKNHLKFNKLGWEEQEFSIEEKQLEFEIEQIYVHIDFLQYTGRKLEYDSSNNCFNTKIMCPPNQTINFFFSLPIQKIFLSSKMHSIKMSSQIKSQLPYPIYLQDGNVLPFHPLNDISDKNTTICELEYINVMQTKVGQVIDESTYHPLVSCIPRPVILSKDKINKSKKNEWKLSNSIWRKQAQIDHKQILKDSFDMDFSSSKISKLISDETDLLNCKNFLFSQYEKIRDIYKELSFVTPKGNNFFVSQNLFNDFILGSEYINNSNIKLSDLDLKFISSCASRPNNSIRAGSVSDRALARFQFLEILIRLVQDKYINSGLGFTVHEGLEDFFQKEGMKNILKESISGQEWRKEYLWNEECYEIMRTHMFFYKSLFNHYASSTKNKTIKIQYIELQEYKQMCKEMKCNQFITDKDENASFGRSIMHQPDELYQQRYIQMQFLEFLEAIARLAHIANIPPKSFYQTEQLQNPNEIHLSLKIQGFLQYIYTTLPIQDIINQSLTSNLQYQFEQTFEKKGISRFNYNQSGSNTPIRLTKNQSSKSSHQSNLGLHRKSISQTFNQNKINFKDIKELVKQQQSQNKNNEEDINISQYQLQQQQMFLKKDSNNSSKQTSPFRQSKRLSLYKQLELNNILKKKKSSDLSIEQKNKSLSSTITNFQNTINNFNKQNQS